MWRGGCLWMVLGIGLLWGIGPAYGESDGMLFLDNRIRKEIIVTYVLEGDTVSVVAPGRQVTPLSPTPLPGGTELMLRVRRVDEDGVAEIPVTVDGDMTVRVLRFKRDGTLDFEIERGIATVVKPWMWGRVKDTWGGKYRPPAP